MKGLEKDLVNANKRKHIQVINGRLGLAPGKRIEVPRRGYAKAANNSSAQGAAS